MQVSRAEDLDLDIPLASGVLYIFRKQQLVFSEIRQFFFGNLRWVLGAILRGFAERSEAHP